LPTTPRQQFRGLLYLICILTDCSTFIVTFTITRTLAERGATPLQLGLLGAGFSLAAAIASIASGLAAQRWAPPVPFLWGTATLTLAILGCRELSCDTVPFRVAYVALGLGLGGLYPPLIGWLNQGEVEPATQRSGVSGRLILFCMAWNVGIMAGQLTGGGLFTQGPQVALGVALLLAVGNLGLALCVARWSGSLPRLPQTPTPSVGDHQRAAAFQKLSWLANLGGMFGGSLVLHLISDLAVSIGIPAERQGEVMALWRVVIIATYLLMHFVHGWQFRMAPSVVSQILGALGLVVISRAESPLSLLAGLALLGQLVGYNYFSGLFYSAAGNPEQNRAFTAAIHEATLAAGMAVGTTVGGALGNWAGHRVPYQLGAVVVVGVLAGQLIGWWRWVRPIDRETNHVC
jgi:MFS family permease